MICEWRMQGCSFMPKKKACTRDSTQGKSYDCQLLHAHSSLKPWSPASCRSQCQRRGLELGWVELWKGAMAHGYWAAWNKVIPTWKRTTWIIRANAFGDNHSASVTVEGWNKRHTPFGPWPFVGEDNVLNLAGWCLAIHVNNHVPNIACPQQPLSSSWD